MNCYKDYYNQCCDYYMKPQMQTQEMYPMSNMPVTDVESMYPEVYYKVYPAICGYCDMIGIKQGVMVNPTKEQLDTMVENIYIQVEPHIDLEDSQVGEMNINTNINTDSPRQFGLGFGFGGRRFLRDIIGILLIRELLRRRPGYGYGYTPFYPGYGSYYPGYLGY